MTDKKIALKAIKVGLLGDTCVGKTAICNSLVNIEFKGDNISTIGSDKVETKIKLKNGKDIKLILWDTAGQERFRSAALNTLKVVQGIAVVFDVTNKDTFKSISMWLEKIKENFNNPCLILLGNKVDLPINNWQVTVEEVKSFAQENHLTYFETSAKTKKGIKEGFAHIVNEIYDKLAGTINNNNIIINNKKKKDDSGSGCFGKKKKKENTNDKLKEDS